MHIYICYRYTLLNVIHALKYILEIVTNLDFQTFFPINSLETVQKNVKKFC